MTRAANLVLLLTGTLLLGITAGLFLHQFMFDEAPQAPVTIHADRLEIPIKKTEPTLTPALPDQESVQDTEIFIPPIPEQKPLQPNDQESYVLELFSPSDDQVEASQAQTAQSQQLERSIAMAYLLANCEIITNADYEATYKALVLYLRTNNVANAVTLAQETANRARASYQLVYRYVPCTDPSLPAIAANIQQWRELVFSVQ